MLGNLIEITHVKPLECTVSTKCSKTFAIIVGIIICLVWQGCEFATLAMRISESWKMILTGVERWVKLPLIKNGTKPESRREGSTAPRHLENCVCLSSISPTDQGSFLFFRRAGHSGLDHPVTHLIARWVCPAYSITNYICSLLIRQARKLNLNGYGVAK